MTHLLRPEETPRGTPGKREPIPPLARKAATAGFVGTFVEYYDFMLYGVLTVFFAPQYFPSDNDTTSFLASLAVFGAGYLARPLGGILFGHIGDRRGRRTALVATIVLMGICSTLVGILPTYEQIGILAPVLLVAARLGQGFSAGAEMLGSMTYALESSPPSRRAFLSSLTPFGCGLGSAAGAALAGGLIAGLGTEAMTSYGWRIPFLTAAPLALVCLWIRTRLEDSPEFTDMVAKKEVVSSPLMETLRKHWRTVLLAGAIALSVSGMGGVNAYFSTYLVGTRQLPAQQVFVAIAIASGAGALAIPTVGRMTDRFGRKPVTVWVLLSFGVMIVPLLWLLGRTESFFGVVVGLFLFMTPAGLLMVPAFALIAELFPREIRYTGAAFGQNIGSVLGSGVAPLAAVQFAEMTGSSLGPALWVGAMLVIGLVALPLTTETGLKPLR